jgi:hypothetical protein
MKTCFQLGAPGPRAHPGARANLGRFALVLLLLCLLQIGCGGGGGGSASQPSPVTITTTALPDGTRGLSYSYQMQAANGRGAATWSLRAGQLPSGLSLNAATGLISGIPTAVGTSNLTLEVADGVSASSEAFSLRILAPLTIATTSLPDGTAGQGYSLQLQAADAIGPVTWSLAAGPLPVGLAISANGLVSGTPNISGSFTATVQAADARMSIRQGFALRIRAHQNNTPATATPLTNGTYHASLSPYADANDMAMADTDYYRFTASAGAVASFETIAQRLAGVVSQLDTVLEIVDANGQRFHTCRDPEYDATYLGGTPAPYNDECLNDDYVGTTPPTTDSKLWFQVPGTPGQTVTFYVHVLDFNGNARPDFAYDLAVSGVN